MDHVTNLCMLLEKRRERALVGRGQVEAEATSGGGDEEQEERGALVELVDQLLAVLLARGAVQACIVVARAQHQLLHDVQHLHAVAE